MNLLRHCWAVAVAAFLLAGCGAGGDEGLSGAKAGLAAQAEPICVETRQKVGDLGSDAAAERDAVQSAVDRLKALPIPGEDEATFTVFTVHAQNLALALDDVAQSRAGNDPARAETALGRAREANEQVKKAARSYGFTECSQGLVS